MSRSRRGNEAERRSNTVHHTDSPQKTAAPFETTGDCRLRLGVVILGAGASKRMGQPKLLLPWGTTTVLGQQLNQWRQLGAQQIAVVHAIDDEQLLHELNRLKAPNRIPNPSPELGMFSSIQLASAWPHWQPELTHWAIVLGDQPHLKSETLQTLLQFASEHPEKSCQPRQDGHGRHPVLLPRESFRSLHHSPHPNLKQHLKASANQITQCSINDPGLALDIDYPAEYKLALQIAGLTPL